MYNYFLDEIQKRLTCKKQSNSNAGPKTPVNTNTFTVRSKSSNNNVSGMLPSNTQSTPVPRSSRSSRTSKGGYRKSSKRRVSKKKILIS